MNQYKRMRLKAGLTCDEVAAMLKPYYPKASKAAVSMAENQALTGVRYTDEAGRLVGAFCGRRKENRSCPYRIVGRLTKADSEAFNASMAVMGHATKNEAVVYAVREYIKHAQRRSARG